MRPAVREAEEFRKPSELVCHWGLMSEAQPSLSAISGTSVMGSSSRGWEPLSVVANALAATLTLVWPFSAMKRPLAKLEKLLSAFRHRPL